MRRQKTESSSQLSIAPYLLLSRLDKPIGIILLLFPCWWGVAYIQKSQFSLKLLGLFLLGAIIMRSAGCILNDFLDKNVDKEVTRTKNRPLAAGTIQSRSALILFVFLCLAGLVVLVQLPPPCWVLGLVGLLLLFIYPLMKRLTHFPQVCLGFAFNLGFLMGIVAVTGDLQSLLSFPIWCIYGGAILWTVGYDTIYAVQDRVDDIRLGVRSTAVLFGKNTRPITLIIYIVSGMLMMWGAHLSLMSIWAGLMIGLVYLWLIHKVWHLDLENSQACRNFFIDNQWLGAIIFLAFML